MMFAAVTVAIVMGAIAERGRVLPAMVFSFLWVTLVYCPIACWAWNPNGWAFKYGVLDYAGNHPPHDFLGKPVESLSGAHKILVPLGQQRVRSLPAAGIR